MVKYIFKKNNFINSKERFFSLFLFRYLKSIKLGILAIVSLAFVGCGSSSAAHDAVKNVSKATIVKLNRAGAKHKDNNINGNTFNNGRTILDKDLVLAPLEIESILDPKDFTNQQLLNTKANNIASPIKVHGKNVWVYNDGDMTANSSDKTAFGMISSDKGNAVNEATLNNVSMLAVNNGNIYNKGTINSTSKNSAGMILIDGGEGYNFGKINVVGYASTGMIGFGNSTLLSNVKEINVHNENSYAIQVKNGATANNSGTINLNDEKEVAMSADNSSHINNYGSIHLNGKNEIAMEATNHSAINNTGYIVLSGAKTTDEHDSHLNSAFKIDSTSTITNHGHVSYNGKK